MKAAKHLFFLFQLSFCILKPLSFAGTLATHTVAHVPPTPTSRWTPPSRKCLSCHQSLFKFSWSSRNVECAVGREVTAALSYSSVGGCSFLAPLTMCHCLAVPSPPPRSTERHCTTWGSTRRVRNLIFSHGRIKCWLNNNAQKGAALIVFYVWLICSPTELCRIDCNIFKL